MAVTNRYFVDPSGGTDSVAGVANGRDPLGLSLVNATYDHTGNGEGERHISSTGAFSSYTFTSGDTIYLLNAAGGVSTGLYEIASKVDNDAILLAADSGLTVDSTSDVDSSDGPLATTQYAADQVSSDGQDVYLMNTATETPSATIDFDTNNGTDRDPIRFIGADSNGVALTTGFYTISGSSLPASTTLINIDAAGEPAQFEFVRFTAGTLYNIDITTSVTVRLVNCRVDNATSHGIRGDATSSVVFARGCEIDSNGGSGIAASSGGRVRVYLSGCALHDNTSHGADVGNGTNIHHSEFYDNAGSGISTDALGNEVVNCTFYGNTSHGVELIGNDFLDVCVNNSFVSNGGYGIDTNNNQIDRSAVFDYNHFHNNTSGQTDHSGGVPGENNQTGDPQFASVTDGSEDFTPDNGSPLDSNGINGVDIGARKAADPTGGGGGLLTHPGMAGGMRG